METRCVKVSRGVDYNAQSLGKGNALFDFNNTSIRLPHQVRRSTLLAEATYGRTTLTGMVSEPQTPFTRTENTPAFLLTDLTEYFTQPPVTARRPFGEDGDVHPVGSRDRYLPLLAGAAEDECCILAVANDECARARVKMARECGAPRHRVLPVGCLARRFGFIRRPGRITHAPSTLGLLGWRSGRRACGSLFLIIRFACGGRGSWLVNHSRDIFGVIRRRLRRDRFRPIRVNDWS